MTNLIGDLRFGVRQLRLNPTFTAVAVLSLALGIGANSAIFQLIDAIRLRTLPVEKPENLAYLDFAKGSTRGGWWSTRSAVFNFAQFESIRAHQQSFSGIAAWSAKPLNLSASGKIRNAEGLFVNTDFFRVLGVPPILGRTFNQQDDAPGCGSSGVVISYAFWQSEFAGDHSVTTRKIRLEGNLFPILGVTPSGFFGVEIGRRFDVAVPLCSDPLFWGPAAKGGRLPRRDAWWLSLMGRLKPGVTLTQAKAQIAAIAPIVMRDSLPPTYRAEAAKKFLLNKLTVEPGGTGVSQLRKRYEDPLWILLATTGLVLLIACANLANLLLARASVREREIAVRQAIGASRSRLVTQLLSESLLLSVFGAVLGAMLAALLSRGLIAFLTTEGNRMFVGLGIDWRVLGFTAAIAVLTCLLFGLAPSLKATGLAPASVMRAGGRGLTAGHEKFSLRRVLVVAQVAMSLVLLAGALLFVRSLQKVLAIDPGFRPEGVFAVNIDMRNGHYSKERIPEVKRQLLETLRGRTGAVSAAEVDMTPVSGSGWDQNTWADGSTGPKTDTLYNHISPGYFQTMGTLILAGRDFGEHDNLSAPKVAMVNEEFAKKIFNGQNPIGRTFRREESADKPDSVFQVIGLIRNTKYYEVREDFRPIAFVPSAQNDDPGLGATFVLRTTANVGEFEHNAEAAVAQINSQFGIDFTVLSRQIQESLMRDRLMAALAGAFGLLAGALAVLGLYGVIAYMVARRRNEIGLRIALGASRPRVIALVLREAIILLALGLVAGTVLAAWAGQAAGALLYGLKPRDPATLAGAIGLLAAVALIASYAPALRASRLQPMDALRDE
ncbi:MAG: putative transport system permease protein [Bryobacterales bacterium]|jgi:predicted permease|nr:putative transport system permease protein [Bryobacterales bacterium]